MNALVLGLILFFGVHSVSIVNDPWRNRMAASMGEWNWKGLYALISLAGFVLIVWGYGLARQAPVVLYTPPAWLHPVAMVLLIPVFPLLLAAYLPGRIQTAARHPMLGWLPPSCGPSPTCSPTACWPTCCCSALSSSGRCWTESR